MKSYPCIYLFLFCTFCTVCSYAQTWRQYADSAQFFQQQNNIDKATGWYGKAISELKRDSADTQTYAALCTQLAGIYKNAAQYAKAEPLYLEAKQIQQRQLGKEHPGYAASCSKLGALYWFMDQYEKAEQLFLEAKQIREKTVGKEHPDYAASCNNLAALYWKMGRYQQAELLYLEAKQIQARVLGTEHPDFARSCNNLALLYCNIGQYEKAEPLYLEAKQIRQKILGKEDPAYAGSCNDLANLYLDMGQYEKAEPLYLEAKQIQEKRLGKQHPEYAGSCNNLANLYLHTSRYKKAEPLYLEAKQIQATVYGKNQPDYAGSCYNLALLYENMGRYTQAVPLYLEAKQIQARVLGRRHPDYEASCEELANCYWLMHRPMLAQKEFEESFAVKCHNLFAVFPFINEKEKATYIKNILGDDETAYSFYTSGKISSAQPYSLSLFHRNLILSSSEALKKQLFSANDALLTSKYEEWVNVKKQLSILYSQPVQERKEDAAGMEEKAGLLEKELTRLSAAFGKQQQRAGWKAVRNSLHADEAAIEFASFHFHDGKRRTDTVFYVANLLRKNRALPLTIFLFTEKQLTDLLLLAGNLKTNASVQQLYTPVGVVSYGKRGAGTALYRLIWEPLEKALPGIKTIYFASSGLLHRIAFAALPVNKKEILSDRYHLVQLATTASLADQHPANIAASDKIVLYGGISYDADTSALKDLVVYQNKNNSSRSIPDDLIKTGLWDELPGTKEEIAGIASLSGKYAANITSVSGLNATEENLKALDGSVSPAVLHIATHGFFFPDPKRDNKDEKGLERSKVFKLSDDPLMRSGLLFAGANNAWQNKPVQGIEDGILTAYEVSNLYLPNTKLVVLSACETGLGDIKGNEGVYGLQRAFKLAGAGNIIMSLWKVADGETAEFMKSLYKNLFAQQPIEEAFYQAQQNMKNKYRLQPYKWAAWVLVR